MLGPGNARWLCLSSSFSRSVSLRSLARIPLSPPLVFLSPLAPRSATPLSASTYLCLPRLPSSLSLARLIDPDPVLFSSLFDSRAGLYHRLTPAARQGLPEGGGGWKREEETASVEGTGGTGPTHRSRDIHFHFIFLARYHRKEGWEEEREREREKGVAGYRGEVGKNFGHSPESCRSLLFVRFANERIA